jgi:Fe2+ or Zn2+ uptake regulation protein
MQATRSTKYTKEILRIVETSGHATNAEILEVLRKTYFDVTATTVHRVTTRLADHGEIAEAPHDINGAIRYDCNTEVHDHFLCQSCGGVKDIDVADDVIPTISKALGGCRITGRLVIYGSCERCLIKKKGTLIK